MQYIIILVLIGLVIWLMKSPIKCDKCGSKKNIEYDTHIACGRCGHRLVKF